MNDPYHNPQVKTTTNGDGNISLWFSTGEHSNGPTFTMDAEHAESLIHAVGSELQNNHIEGENDG